MNRICPICQKEVKPTDSNHYFRCNNTIAKTDAKYQFILYNFPYISNKDNLHLEYEIRLKSLPMLKEEFDIDFKSVIFLLEYHGIQKRSISESSNLISVEKYKKTCKSKYGVENISSLASIKDKKKKTFTKNYGVDNIWKSEEYYEWLHEHMLEKYGAKSVPNLHGNGDSWGWGKLSDEDKIKRLKTLHSNFSSKLELRVKNVIELLNINFDHQFNLKGNAYDFIIGNNFLIEVNGDYWHANPSLFTSEDKFFFRGGVTAKEIWDKDLKKTKIALNNGFKVLSLWESDLNKMSDDEIKIKIKEYYDN